MKVAVTGELDLNQKEQQILDLTAAIGPFNATFAHCGYSEDGVYPGVEIPINPNADPPGWGPLGPPGAGQLAWAHVCVLYQQSHHGQQKENPTLDCLDQSPLNLHHGNKFHHDIAELLLDNLVLS
eukprot:jgi/Psemu1/3313/gm1.3313_g